MNGHRVGDYDFYSIWIRTLVQRWDKAKKGRYVSCPKVVKIYNQMMGGVEYYRFFKTKNWPLKVILHWFNLAIINS